MAFSSIIGNENQETFLEILEGLLRQRVKSVPPLSSGEWLRVSSFGGICSREEVLCSILNVHRNESVNPDLGTTFEIGHAAHWVMQNRVLAKTNRFIGRWRCTWCGESYGSIEEGMVPRPEECIRCGAYAGDEPRVFGKPDKTVKANSFIYVEQWVGDSHYRIGGHPDGFMVDGDPESYSSKDLIVMEFKTASSGNFYKYKKAPDLVHVVQCQLYMWLTGARKSKIVYIDKGTFGIGSIADHDVLYDEEVVERSKNTIDEIRQGILHEKLPQRVVCATRDCNRAMACRVADECFSRE